MNHTSTPNPNPNPNPAAKQPIGTRPQSAAPNAPSQPSQSPRPSESPQLRASEEDDAINTVARSFADHYETRATLQNHMNGEKTLMVDYARLHPNAFCGKRLHFKKGVFVQLVTRQYIRFAQDKVSHDWIQRMAAAGNADAIIIRLDPKKLSPDAATLALLREINYTATPKEVATASRKKQLSLFDDDTPATANRNPTPTGSPTKENPATPSEPAP